MTATDSPAASSAPLSPRQIVEHAIAHLDHVLPAQAPILNFVHHNTLHGYQHLPFEEALAAAEALTGIHAYLPDAAFRKLYQADRIVAADLDAVFAQRPELEVERVLARVGEREIRRGEVLRIALVYGVEALTLNDLVWRMEELEATRRFEADVPEPARQRLLEHARAAGAAELGAALEDVWRACLEGFRLPAFKLHPEELVDLQLNVAKTLLARFRQEGAPDEQGPVVHKRMQAEASALIARLFDDVGEGSTLRGVLRALTGHDLFDRARPYLIRLCAAYLDEGLAAWTLPDRTEGLYAAWRRLAARDPAWTLTGLS
ncbi:MAG: putative inorganic carbon transporter subunit DabA, partial [Candidatus Competibacter sp.]